MPNKHDMALVLSRVSARFDDEKKHISVLEDISLSIPAGGFVSIIGPSGAGKSTLMRVILGLIPHSNGTIVRNFSRPAMVFQNYALFPWLTALHNVAFGLKMEGVPKKERERVACEKLKEVGLGHLENHYPAMLSGGQRQRIGLARALAIAPDFLIMDEPFSNLDTITAESLKADILEIWRTYGMTVLMVNHLITDAIELSDQVVIMSTSSHQPGWCDDTNSGRIQETVSINLPRPRDTRTERFFKEVDYLTEVIRTVS